MSENAEALESFTRYCQRHPEQRFWQALRNWSKYRHIIGVTNQADHDFRVPPGCEATWYLRDLQGSAEYEVERTL